VFYLNDIKIDTGRGEIHYGEVIHSIEPKVMSVLFYLCQSLNTVISPEMLFEKVWPHSIYSPSSVRRCITLLRTALNDEDKVVIITHPKRGYSLKATLTRVNTSKKILNNSFVIRSILIYLTILLLIIFIAYYDTGVDNTVLVQQSVIKITDIKPFTATKDNERFSRYSPDGKYLAFIRASDTSPDQAHIWLKHVDTLQEHRINRDPAHYIYLAWSSVVNSQQTLVAAINDSDGVSFEQIRLDNNLHYQSSSIEYVKKAVTWISPFFVDHNKVIYFLTFANNQSSLYSYHLGTRQEIELLAQTANFKPYKIALSHDKKRLLILGFNQQHLSQIKTFSLLDHSTTLLTTLDSNWYFIDWLPDGQSLLLSDGKGLKQLMLLTNSSTRQLTANVLHSLDFKNFDFLRYPHVSPNGQSITFNKESIDQDIWLTPLQGETKKLLLVNSNTADWGAKLSPDNNQFAFISARNGHSQLFIYDFTRKFARLVYANNAQDLAIAPPIWSADGLQLISAANDHVFVVQLTDQFKNNEMSKVSVLPNIIGKPLQSYHRENSILMLSKRDNENAWVKVDLSTLTITHLLWAGNTKPLLNHNDQLFFFKVGQLLDEEQNVMVNVDGRVNKIFAKADKFYALVSEKEKRHLVEVSFNDLTKQELIKISDQKDDEIWDVGEGFTLTGSTLIDKDLIQLAIQQ